MDARLSSEFLDEFIENKFYGKKKIKMFLIR